MHAVIIIVLETVVIDDRELDNDSFGVRFARTAIGDNGVPTCQCQFPITNLFEFVALFRLSHLLHYWD